MPTPQITPQSIATAKARSLTRANNRLAKFSEQLAQIEELVQEVNDRFVLGEVTEAEYDSSMVMLEESKLANERAVAIWTEKKGTY